MRTKASISLSIPGASESGRYFSFFLKQNMERERTEYLQPKRILVIVDAMNNFKDFLKLLFNNKIVDKRLNWTFGDGHLVIVDNHWQQSEQMIDCWWLIYSLEEKARREGGYVHLIVRNTDSENIYSDWRYMHPKYAKKKPGAKTPTSALYYGNSELWDWLCTKNSIEKIGNILFVHGNRLSELNIPSTSVAVSAQLQPALIFSDEERVDSILARFTVNTIVTGYGTSDKGTSYFNGKLINVAAPAENVVPDVLLIKRKHFYLVGTDRHRIRIK